MVDNDIERCWELETASVEIRYDILVEISEFWLQEVVIRETCASFISHSVVKDIGLESDRIRSRSPSRFWGFLHEFGVQSRMHRILEMELSGVLYGADRWEILLQLRKS